MNPCARSAFILFSTLAIALACGGSQTQKEIDSKYVGFEGLQTSYDSCAPVAFSVRSISQVGIYLEVYVEDFKNGAWELTDFPYDLRQPMSRYVKRAYADRKLMKSGESISLTYDRCSKPKFIKMTQCTFTQKIVDKDRKASNAVLQRFLANAYTMKDGDSVLLAKEYSLQVSRIAPKD